MRLDIQGRGTAEGPGVRRHIEQRALFELARYGQRIGAVRIRVSDRPHAADPRYHCGVAVTIAHDDGTSAVVLARGQDDDVYRLIDSVLVRAGRLAGGEIARAEAARDARAYWTEAAAAGARRGS